MLCSIIAFGNLISVSLRLFRLWAAINFDAALSFDADGVRLITEQRTTGSGDGERGGDFVFKLIDSSVGRISFSFINFGGFRSLSADFVVGTIGG